jgi:hypothetical protein
MREMYPSGMAKVISVRWGKKYNLWFRNWDAILYLKRNYYLQMVHRSRMIEGYISLMTDIQQTIEKINNRVH